MFLFKKYTTKCPFEGRMLFIGCVIWHINHYRLFNTISCLYIVKFVKLFKSALSCEVNSLFFSN